MTDFLYLFDDWNFINLNAIRNIRMSKIPSGFKVTIFDNNGYEIAVKDFDNEREAEDSLHEINSWLIKESERKELLEVSSKIMQEMISKYDYYTDYELARKSVKQAAYLIDKIESEIN